MHNLGILQAGATPERGFGSPEYVANVHRTIANPTAPVAAFSPEYTPSSVAASPQYNGSMYTAASPTSPSYTKVTSYSSTAAGSPEYNRNAPSTPGYHPQLASPVSPSYSPSCRYVCAVYSLLGRLSMPLGGFFGGGICRSGGDSLADFRGPCCCFAAAMVVMVVVSILTRLIACSRQRVTLLMHRAMLLFLFVRACPCWPSCVAPLRLCFCLACRYFAAAFCVVTTSSLMSSLSS